MDKTYHNSTFRWLVAALAMAALCVPASAAAQGEGETDEPGVIDGIPEDEPDDEERREAQQVGDVIGPEDVDPHERYDLPPNFDPGFQPRATPGHTRVTIDFREASLEEVVKFFAGVMGINFIIADSLQADKTITIISPEEVTVDEAYRAFLSALEMNGLTLVPHGSFLKILEADRAISEPMAPYDVGDDIPVEARMVTAIIPVENASVEEIEDVIGNFITDHASIIRYHSNLIITENAANLRRIRAIIQRLDRGDTASNLYVYRVQHANAVEVEEQLREIFGTDEEDAEPQTARERRRQRRQRQDDDAEPADDVEQYEVRIDQMISDERTNQLIIVANEPSFDRIREMIEILDVQTAVGGEVHVKFLEYANAEELSQTLSELAQAAQQQDDEGGVASLLQGEVQVTAHTPTNSLVVVASPRDFLALGDVIDQLDRPRRQVYVEAVIMEIGIDVNRSLHLGTATGLSQDLDFLIPDSAVEQGLVESTRGAGFGQTNFQGIEELIGPGLGLGLLGPAVQLPGTGISLPAVALLLQATQTDQSVNVLSTPSILTLDNEEAEIIVGERVPFARAVGGGGLSGLMGLGALTGMGQDQQQQQRGTTGGLTGGQAAGALGGLGGALGGLGGGLGRGMVSPIDYEDVGIELRILPQVNESDYVRLEVDQEISDIKGAGGGAAELAPTRTRRNAQTTVLVRDQSTIVIGGLMRDVERETISKVPLLGDVPVLGMLFRSTDTMTTKQNLVLMLTPYIIEGEHDLQKIYDRKMEEREELMRLFSRRDMEYIERVDFHKKTGLMDRMRNEISEAQREEEARQRALEEFEEHGPRYRILGGEAAEPNDDTTDGDSED